MCVCVSIFWLNLWQKMSHIATHRETFYAVTFFLKKNRK